MIIIKTKKDGLTWIFCTLIIMIGLVIISFNISESEAIFRIEMDNNTLEAVNNMDEIIDAQKDTNITTTGESINIIDGEFTIQEDNSKFERCYIINNGSLFSEVYISQEYNGCGELGLYDGATFWDNIEPIQIPTFDGSGFQDGRIR